MNDHHKVYRNNPRLKANIFSKLFLCWIFPYLSYGSKHELKAEDLFQLAPENQCDLLGDKLEKCWKAEVEETRRKQRRPSLLKVIIKTFGCNYLKYAIFSLASTFTPILLPLVLKLLIAHFDESSTTSTLEACSYVLLLMLTVTTASLLEVHSKFSLMYVGRQVKTACSALVYRKLLRLSINSQDESDGGKLITLLSNDVAQFEEAFTSLHVFLVIPIVLIMNGFLMWRVLGVTTVFAVLLVALQHIPFQVFAAYLMMKLREKMARKTDQRLLLMDEIINGIRVIKMYTWEKPFEHFILLIRRKELNLIAKKMYFDIGLKYWYIYGVRVSLYLTIAIMISYEAEVTSLILFPLIQCNYDMNRQTGLELSNCLTSLAYMIASVNRIEDFLLREEVTPFSKLCSSKNKNKVVVTLQNVSVSSPECQNHIILENLSISIVPNKLYALVGKIGSGKSSLLKIILGELEPKSGQVLNYGDISFASQEPWLFNGSVRSNILLGEPFNEKKYNQVISSCALLKDFDQLPHGDKTIVGERGAALSGGQMARINLARAVYRNADVYLLDDPLASVDYYVGKCLFENCIKGLLKNKVRVLVTQNLKYMKKVDEIILINNGRLEYQGHYTNFQKTDFFQHLIKSRELDAASKNARKESHYSIPSSPNLDNTEENEIPESNETEEFLREYKEVEQLKSYEDPEENIEQIKRGKIPLSLFKEFYNNTYLILCSIIFLVISQSSIGVFDYVLTTWSRNQDKYFASLNSTISNRLQTKSNFSDSQITLFYIIGGIVLVSVIASILELIFFIKLNIVSCEQLHANMIFSLLRTAVQFFDNNDSGRILNRFSQDLGVVDEKMPLTFIRNLKLILLLFVITLQVIIASPYMIIIFIISFILIIKMTIFFCKFIRSLKRLEAQAKALVLSHSNATFKGLITIRSFGAQAIVQKNFNINQDNYMAASFTNIDIFWSYSLWIQIATNVLLVLTAFFLLFLKSTGITSAIVGHIMFQTYFTNRSIHLAADIATILESLMISTERTLEYTKLDQETVMENKCLIGNSASTWPSDGRIKFDHLYLKYSNSVDPVLKNLNFVIEPATKVGIIGRTGAGKSSLAAALFRLAETEGSLFIDNIDIKTVALKDLRSKISILPQKSVLFSTSLRNNLDPMGLFDDAKIWSALKCAKLDNTFHSLDEELDQKSLSNGQCQLLCLARATLKNNKIFIMDEAAANMDAHTEDLIYSTIKENFKDCTMLIIAHKLNSVIDCDKILVVDAGQIIEYDEPQVLLQQKNGYFYKMWQAFK